MPSTSNCPTPYTYAPRQHDQSPPRRRRPAGPKAIVPKIDATLDTSCHPEMVQNGTRDAIRKQKITRSASGDTLAYLGKMRLAKAYALKNLEERALQHGLLARTDFPALCVVHGENDTVADIRGSHMLLEQTRSRDKAFVEVAGGHHNLFVDPRTPEVFDTALRFFSSHLLAAAAPTAGPASSAVRASGKQQHARTVAGAPAMWRHGGRLLVANGQMHQSIRLELVVTTQPPTC